MLRCIFFMVCIILLKVNELRCQGDSHSPINIGRVLAFFEEASHAELMSIPGCSRRKAEAIVTLRPFGSYEQLVSL